MHRTRSLQLTSVLRALSGRGLPPELPVRPGAPVGPREVGPPAADLTARALAAGAPLAAAAALAAVVTALPARERAQVERPLEPAPGATVLRWGTAGAVQTSPTTCGSAVLAELLAAGDPTVAYWLVTGRTLAGHRAPELDGVPDAPGPAARFGALQEALSSRSRAGALGGLPWPAALGTPPWGLARAARFPGVRYRSLLVDDSRPDELRDVLVRVGRAVDRGVPVPLYTGGDLSTGLTTAVPRHVVLATSRAPGGFGVYEPTTGEVAVVAADDLLLPHGPLRALGGWTHVCWAVLPVRP